MGRLKQLLISIEPNIEENLIGYIVRLTEANDYDTPSWILQLSGIKKYLHSKCNFVRNGSIDLSGLAQLTGQSTDSLSPLQYARVSTEPFGEGYLMHGSPVPQYMIRVNKPKVCPECLDETGYARKVWDFAPLTACPLHQRLLLEDCPSCCVPIRWSRKNLSICHCGFDWRKTSRTPVQGYELKVSEYVYKSCKLIKHDLTEGPTTNDNPLLGLDLHAFSSALFFIASQLDGIIDTKGKHLAPSANNPKLHTLLSKSFKVFENWPENFIGFLNWRRAQNPDSISVKGLRRDFAQYKSALYLQLSSSKFDFIRAAFENYLISEWVGGNASAISRVNKSSGIERKYLSRREVKETLRISISSIEQLIVSKTLKAVIHRHKKGRLILIEAASVNALWVRLEKALGIKQVETILGLTSKRIKELVVTGLLHPFRGPTIDGYSDWKFDSSEVEALWRDLERSVKSNSAKDHCEKIDFLMALRMFRRFNIDIGHFLKAVISGKVSPCSLGNKRKGIRTLLFNKEVLSLYAKKVLG